MLAWRLTPPTTSGIVYSPRQRRSALLLELPDEQGQAYLFGLLAAIETCLKAHDISSARIELDGKPYLLEARA